MSKRSFHYTTVQPIFKTEEDVYEAANKAMKEEKYYDEIYIYKLVGCIKRKSEFICEEVDGIER